MSNEWVMCSILKWIKRWKLWRKFRWILKWLKWWKFWWIEWRKFKRNDNVFKWSASMWKWTSVVM